MELTRHYGVHRILGFRNGYQGFIARYGYPVLELTPDVVRDINEDGGTILGSSRGQQDPEEIVDCLEQLGVNILFVIGGDGSLHGAQKIADVIAARGHADRRRRPAKTIDNDIPFIDHSFGFRTAFSRATESIRAAHVEARSAPGGVGLVKVMGRHSGFIACYAALAKNDADYVLIPEVPFELDGEHGFLAHLRRTVRTRGHAVIIAAEGAGQEHVAAAPAGADASGNVRLHDIQRLLQQRITEDFAAHGQELNLKLLDPSYVIRSVPANPYDSVYCVRLAHAAVHAGMAGRTRGGRRALARPLRAHPDPRRDQPAQHGGPRRRPVALRARGHRPARPLAPAHAGADARRLIGALHDACGRTRAIARPGRRASRTGARYRGEGGRRHDPGTGHPAGTQAPVGRHGHRAGGDHRRGR